MIQDILQKVEHIPILYQFISIFIISLIPFLEAHVAVPVGVLLKLPFVPIALLAVAGNWLSVMFVILFSSWIKSKFTDPNGDSFVHRRFQKGRLYFNRFGVPGLSLAGPIIGANHIGALICTMAAANKKNIIIWQTVSILLWAVGSGLLIYYGRGYFV
ncbi:small multi-drug export protein [Paenibacillus ihbetae]|uniref:Small multi-drug export protein n=1 Tax=Paenibacillus ihbetae TaxID=1870820 RepID=A0A1B2DUA1_9BACL|nr:small multi-drug export protein [Paenibacillus ihbetae]ANY71286.1 hypothetical protein BBD41_01055 [Paenibacillus ihbetae]OOC61352.1 hypothetical protein BBD40_05295 [Paenibacillus ihbetae]